MPAPKDFVQMWRDLQRRVTQLEQRRIRELGYEGLRNPQRGDFTTTLATNFALTTTPTTLASVTWTVPDGGFDQVQVSGAAKVFAVNSTAGLDYVYARSRIVRISDGVDIIGAFTPTAVSASGGSGTSVGLGGGVVGLLPGDQVRIEVQGWASFAGWATNASNVAEWSGVLNWFRTG